ncbi:hypothetical protein [Vibrio diabolicus]|uniref:hypothetical protein n=1 Tax=Vibrio diabolicus TaxID=50719 RepID=UPI00249501C3|nr:hypothetical protein [Vibrio diabolicus]
MIGLVGFSVFIREGNSGDQAWDDIKKSLTKAFGLKFVTKTVGVYDVEFCFNGLAKSTEVLDSFRSYFVGAMNDMQEFSTDDHGALLEFETDFIRIKNDWLGSVPIFYNETLSRISTFFQAIDQTGLEEGCGLDFDSPGLAGYFKFGYSVFEETPITGVKFAQPCSTFTLNIDNSAGFIEVLPTSLELKDDVNPLRVDNVVQSYLDKVFYKNTEKINLPLSGGLDSRWLSGLLRSRDVKCFTYSGNRFNYEAVYAKSVANQLNLDWELIPLRNYYKHIGDWCDLYGLSTHAHGMYQIEFYKKIKQHTHGEYVVSGIFADIWAGNSSLRLESYKDLVNLGYSHGLALSGQLGFDYSALEPLAIGYYKKLESEGLIYFDALHRVRMKLILISYLMSLPRYMGFVSVTPFLNKEIALSMLSLSKNDRTNRKWQKDIIKYHRLDVEGKVSNLYANFVNNMDANAYLNCNSDFFDIASLSKSVPQEIFSANLESHFKKMGNNTLFDKLNLFLSSTRGVQRILDFLGVKSDKLRKLRDYQCIYPIYHYRNRRSSNDK